MKAVDASLKDFNYAAETYDAVMIIALAADMAKTDGIDMAKEINGITRDGTKCTDYASCKKLIDAGTDLDYDGVSGPIEFSGNGEPLQASYGILTFGADDHIDDSKTIYKQAKAPVGRRRPGTGRGHTQGRRRAEDRFDPAADRQPRLPRPTGVRRRSTWRQRHQRGRWRLGKPVVGDRGDSGDAHDRHGQQTTDRLLGENVDAIIGAASSGVSLKVIDKITGAGVVRVLTGQHLQALSTYADKGLYFRTAPSDILQGAVLGEVIAEAGTRTRPHGPSGRLRHRAPGGPHQGLDRRRLQGRHRQGVRPETADTFTTEVNEVKAADPDAIVLISFDEASKILNTMVEAGIGPKNVAVYGVDGDTGNTLGDNFDQGK